MKVVGLFLLFLCGTAAVLSESAEEEWNTFKEQYHKNYASEEEENFRFKIFKDNKHKIAKHNKKFEKGEVGFKLKLNKYADMLPHEVNRTLNGFNGTVAPALFASHRPATFTSPANVDIPDGVDWRENGAVTEVKDQRHCGSCWAFSATGALEGQHFRKTGVLVALSEQNLMDCSGGYGNSGCRGGRMDHAFQYIKDNGGIDTEASYPYEAEDDMCRYTPDASGASDIGYGCIPSGSEKKLKEALATIGPVSVSIDASLRSFHLYSAGVYDDPDCSNHTLHHGVLAVGYGTTDEGQDYWLIKNSWGSSWGEEGYIRIARNQNNLCGVATHPVYPIV